MNINKDFCCYFKEYKGYRRIVEKELFKSFKKIKNIEGFNITYFLLNRIYFTISTQLIRKLKIKNINNKIKMNSNEYLILNMLERSREVEEKTNDWTSYSYSGYYNYNCKDLILIKDIEEKIERKNFIKNQERLYNQKAKRYENKRGFRK